MALASALLKSTTAARRSAIVSSNALSAVIDRRYKSGEVGGLARRRRVGPRLVAYLALFLRRPTEWIWIRQRRDESRPRIISFSCHITVS